MSGDLTKELKKALAELADGLADERAKSLAASASAEGVGEEALARTILVLAVTKALDSGVKTVELAPSAAGWGLTIGGIAESAIAFSDAAGTALAEYISTRTADFTPDVAGGRFGTGRILVGGETLLLAIKEDLNGAFLVNIAKIAPPAAKFSEFGLDDGEVEGLKRLVKMSHGIIIVAGPENSGKTGTIKALLSAVDRNRRSVVALRAGSLLSIDGVIEVDPGSTVSERADRLLTAVRHDADVIVVDGLDKAEVLGAALDAIGEGILILGHVDAQTTIDALMRVVASGADRFLLAHWLRGVVFQRRASRLCPACKESYSSSQEERETLDIEDKELTLFRMSGCEECAGKGYLADAKPLAEVAVTGESLAEALISEDSNIIAGAVSESRTRNLYDKARELVLAGEMPFTALGVFEVDRVILKEQDSEADSPPQE